MQWTSAKSGLKEPLQNKLKSGGSFMPPFNITAHGAAG